MSPFTDLASPAAATVAGAVVAGLVAAIVQALSARRDETAGRKELKAVQEEEKSISSTGQGQPADVSLEALWSLTQRRIDAYHRIATSQSKRSFLNTQIATAIGFALIIYVGYLAANANSTAGAVSAGAVGIIGGGLSAYVASTFMKSQADASGQLREFFAQPVELSRALFAERLLKEIEDNEAKDANVGYIIRSMMMTTRESNAPGQKLPGIPAARKSTRAAENATPPGSSSTEGQTGA